MCQYKLPQALGLLREVVAACLAEGLPASPDQTSSSDGDPHWLLRRTVGQVAGQLCSAASQLLAAVAVTPGGPDKFQTGPRILFPSPLYRTAQLATLLQPDLQADGERSPLPWRAGHLMRLQPAALARCQTSTAAAAAAVGCALAAAPLMQGASDRVTALQGLGPQLAGTQLGAAVAGTQADAGGEGLGSGGWRHAAVMAEEMTRAGRALGLEEDICRSFEKLAW